MRNRRSSSWQAVEPGLEPRALGVGIHDGMRGTPEQTHTAHPLGAPWLQDGPSWVLEAALVSSQLGLFQMLLWLQGPLWPLGVRGGKLHRVPSFPPLLLPAHAQRTPVL